MNNPSQHTNQTNQTNDFQTQGTNPFTADLKGEFSSNFGTNTNAVSQIFKEGGFTGNNNTKWIAIGVAVLLVLVAGYFFLMGEEEDPFASAIDQPINIAQPAQVDTPVTEAEMAEAVTEQDYAMADDASYGQEQIADTMVDQAPAASGAVSLITPANGDAREYDETMGPAQFQWEGGAGTIVFSRSRSMRPAYMRVPVSGSSYSFYNPYPGTWYWQVETANGASEIRSFNVANPKPRNLSLVAPQSGSALAGNGGQISWQGDNKIAFYRVELSNTGSFANPTYRFATSGMALQLQNVTSGSYELRIGGFSEVAGRWEYTNPVQVQIQ
jgi:hypothetical protein